MRLACMSTVGQPQGKEKAVAKRAAGEAQGAQNKAQGTQVAQGEQGAPGAQGPSCKFRAQGIIISWFPGFGFLTGRTFSIAININNAQHLDHTCWAFGKLVFRRIPLLFLIEWAPSRQDPIGPTPSRIAYHTLIHSMSSCSSISFLILILTLSLLFSAFEFN